MSELLVASDIGGTFTVTIDGDGGRWSDFAL